MEHDNLIFSFEDVKSIRKVSNNINDFEIYAREVQALYVQKLLGDSLYAEILGDPGNSRFDSLLNGKKYEKNNRMIIFRGVKYYACYLWLYLYTKESGAALTPIGVQQYVDGDSESALNNSYYHNAKNQYLSIADAQEEHILAYLSDHASDYPDFGKTKSIEQAEEDSILVLASKKRFKNPY